jgi:hypothetical protein
MDEERGRFPSACNGRDAQPYGGWEACLVVKRVPVDPSAPLAMGMVKVSPAGRHPLRPHWPGCSVNELKTWFRSRQ